MYVCIYIAVCTYYPARTVDCVYGWTLTRRHRCDSRGQLPHAAPPALTSPCPSLLRQVSGHFGAVHRRGRSEAPERQPASIGGLLSLDIYSGIRTSSPEAPLSRPDAARGRRLGVVHRGGTRSDRFATSLNEAAGRDLERPKPVQRDSAEPRRQDSR